MDVMLTWLGQWMMRPNKAETAVCSSSTSVCWMTVETVIGCRVGTSGPWPLITFYRCGLVSVIVSDYRHTASSFLFLLFRTWTMLSRCFFEVKTRCFLCPSFLFLLLSRHVVHFYTSGTHTHALNSCRSNHILASHSCSYITPYPQIPCLHYCIYIRWL